eukprot:4231911-Amphidinium_carterae.1
MVCVCEDDASHRPGVESTHPIEMLAFQMICMRAKLQIHANADKFKVKVYDDAKKRFIGELRSKNEVRELEVKTYNETHNEMLNSSDPFSHDKEARERGRSTGVHSHEATLGTEQQVDLRQHVWRIAIREEPSMLLGRHQVPRAPFRSRDGAGLQREQGDYHVTLDGVVTFTTGSTPSGFSSITDAAELGKPTA